MTKLGRVLPFYFNFFYVYKTYRSEKEKTIRTKFEQYIFFSNIKMSIDSSLFRFSGLTLDLQ
jgi:hypothetical protein